jgi:hypothetical protein
VAVIEKNRDGLLKPRCRQDQVKRMVAVNIARGDMQAPGRPDNPNRLPTGCT